MGVDAMRIRDQISRYLFISIRASYKSVRKHPFLVGMVCFLIFLYRSFPFLFSLLVSASPVLVCTAVLLGTLLSFGELNIPEIENEKQEEEEEVTHEISSLKSGVVGDASVVVDKDENCFIEKFVGKRKDTTVEVIGEENWSKNRVNKIEGDASLGDYAPIINERSREIKFEKQAIEVVERNFKYLELETNGGIKEKENQGKDGMSNAEAVEGAYSLVPNIERGSLQGEDDRSAGECSEAGKSDHLDPEYLSWKRANGDNDDEEEEEEEDELSDFGSDGAESSSPDASMADILPMLDELHPLLHEETPLLHEQSVKIKESNAESDEDIEKLADREEDGEENDNEEEEEEAQEGKEDDSKSAIKWTEDDQKNLMDLGTLEIERNQRLESLIARRRARRNLRSVAEKNLIDLDGADLPNNIPQISTTRHNPFDLPYDYDDVPGSAPSVLLPRRNPFDIPYDSSEEKPDLKGDSFQQEFSPFQHREPFFRRHESFSVGPSVLGAPKHDRPDFRWKPYFVPERYATEGTTYPTFQRQLSEASDSKLSSVPDSESVSSAVEEEDKLNEEPEMISSLDRASVLVERGSLTSEDVDPAEQDVDHDRDEITLGDVENHHEIVSTLSTLEVPNPVELDTSEILLRMEPGDDEYSSGSSQSSLLEVDEKISEVRHESMNPKPSNGQIDESPISTQSSFDSDFHFKSKASDENEHGGPVEEPIGNHTAESCIMMQTTFDSGFHFTSGVKDNTRSMESALEPVGNYGADSSLLMQAPLTSDSHFLSEVVDNDHKTNPIFESMENHVTESGIPSQTSSNSDFLLTSGVEVDNQHKEPVYDSSPQAVEELLSLLSISSDTQGEKSGLDSPRAVAEFVGDESLVHSSGKDASGYKDVLQVSSQESLDENGSKSREFTEMNYDVTKSGLSGDDLTSVVSISADSSQSHLMSEAVGTEGLLQHERDQIIANAEFRANDLCENLDSKTSSFEHMPSNDLRSANEERHPAVSVEEALGDDRGVSFSDVNLVNEDLFRKEETHHFEHDQLHSSSLDADMKQLYLSDKAVVEPSSNDDGDSKEPSLILPESVKEANVANDINVPEIFDKDTSETISVPPDSLVYKSKIDEVDLRDNILDKIVYEDSNHVLGHHNSSVPGENISEDEDEIKEIDEGLLSELDTVGDFRVKEEVISESLHDEPIDLSMAEIKPELPVLEVRSVTDIELAFQQLHEGADVEEVILPSMIEEQSVATECKGLGEINLNQQVVEARSLEDIHVAVNQAEEGRIEEMSKPDDGALEGTSGSSEELPVLELRSMNDIDIAFKQINEGVDVEEVILPSTIERHLAVDESTDSHQSGFDLPVVEARSLEDLHTVMMHVTEGHIEELSEPSGAKGESPEANKIEDDQRQSSSDLQVPDPLGDDHHTMNQAPKLNTEELSKSAPIEKTASYNSEENEMVPTKNCTSTVEVTEPDFLPKSVSSGTESGAKETSTIASDELKHELDEKSGS